MQKPRSRIAAMLPILALTLVHCGNAEVPPAIAASDEQGEMTARISDEEVIKRFYQIFYSSTDPVTIWNNTWFGILTHQNPLDVWITQEIIWQVKPDFIVEAGTYQGGSAAMWATILEQVVPDGRVITIDIEDHTARAQELSIYQRKVDFLHGSSTDPKIVAEVAERVKGGRVLVILDSLHTQDHVKAELDAYAPIVSVGSYLIVQDTFVNGHPIEPEWGPGPYEAVEVFLETTEDFVIDKSRERLIMTYNPNGFLRRVR